MGYFKGQSSSATEAPTPITHQVSCLSQPNIAETSLSQSSNAEKPSPFKRRDIISLLPLPNDGRKLTRSQRLFSVMMNIPYQSLTISGDEEFFLFMDMQDEFKWMTFNMTFRKYVIATIEFNSRMEQKAKAKGTHFITKNPRALMEKLTEIEEKITERLSTKNFVCKLHNY